MNIRKFPILNWFLIVLVTILISSFQTTFWFQIVGSLPAPLLWLNLVIYIILYRKYPASIFMNYFLGLIFGVYTSMSMGKLWTIILILSFLIGFIKSRVFWPGVRYFVLLSFGSTLAFEILSVSFSLYIDKNPAFLHLFTRFLEIILTPLSAAPIYWLMTWIDQITERETVSERTELPS